MIRCKLTEHLNPDATQTGMRVGRAVSGDTLTLGRAAASKIYLPDPRVRMEHARIRRAEDGHLYLDAVTPVLVDGRQQSVVRLAMRQQIVIGPYTFFVEELDDGAALPEARLTMSFALSHGAVDDAAQAGGTASDGVVQGWLTRRRLGWVGAALVLLFCLAIPAWRAYDLQPEVRQATAQSSTLQPVVATLRLWTGQHLARLDNFWNPGPISSAHQGIASECSSCHARPFERVADASCTSCHTRTGPHVPEPALQHAAFAGQRCATCHKEHQGTQAMRLVDAMGCAQCHGNLRAHAPQSTLPAMSDFARDHAPFRLSLRTAAAPGDVQGAVRRVPQTSALRNETGLKFPHDLHLAADGIKSPTGPAATGGRVVLECSNCHRPDAAGARFEPIRMARDCQGCHRLSVDPQLPERQVPHAAPEVVATAVREIFASLAVDRVPARVVTVNSLLQRPAAAPLPSQTLPAGRFVEDRSRGVLAAMFESRKGVCSTCHAVRQDGAAAAPPAPARAGAAASTAGAGPGAVPIARSPWQIAPVVLTAHWLPHNRFTHAQHAAAPCASCHAAGTSTESAQVLIPDLQVCQSCHAGVQPEKNKVVSRCDSCHGFHLPTENPVFRRPVVVSSKGAS